jgi:hypothetical protein
MRWIELQYGEALWDLMSKPVPNHPDKQFEYWHWGDMQAGFTALQ